MAGRYDNFRNLAQRLITKNADGQILKLSSFEDGSLPDPDKPWNPGDPSLKKQVENVPFVKFGYKVAENALQATLASGSAIGKLLVPNTKELVYIAALDTQNYRPRGGDKIQENDAELFWEVLEVEVLNPGLVDILYVLYVGD